MARIPGTAWLLRMDEIALWERKVSGAASAKTRKMTVKPRRGAGFRRARETSPNSLVKLQFNSYL